MRNKISNGSDGISIFAECEQCGNKFRISSDSHGIYINHKKEYNLKGRPIYLTFYDCPGCGKRHFVQIDDDRTLNVLKTNNKRFVKMAANKLNGKSIPKMQSDKYKRQTDYLRKLRNGLMKEYTGTIFHDEESGKDFELRFSV